MITRDTVTRGVIARYPETGAVFDHYRVYLCCGGVHSIEKMAEACGIASVDELVDALNKEIGEREAGDS